MITLDQSQLEAVYQLKNGAILCGGVGSGKSRTALTYYYTEVCGGGCVINGEGAWSKMSSPKDLIILTTARKRDDLEWESELTDFLLYPYPNVQGVNITVDSWNNIKKYIDIEGAVFILDEQRISGTGVWVKSFYKIAKNNHWFLLTATPGDKWLDYIPVFVANGFYRNKTEFMSQHVVMKANFHFPQIDRYVGIRKLEQLRDSLLVDIYYDRHTIQHHINVDVNYDRELFQRVWRERWNIYKDQPIENVAELYSAMRKVVNSDESRLSVTRKLVKQHGRVIVFYNFDYELELLKIYFRGYTVREWNGHRHDGLPEGDTWLYLVQYTAGAEGWNCIKTDTVIFFSQNYSYRAMIQAAGRIDRRNTEFVDLYFYRLMSTSFIDKAIYRCYLQKKDFNEPRGRVKNIPLNERRST